jgi:hypothetical protein
VVEAAFEWVGLQVEQGFDFICGHRHRCYQRMGGRMDP